MPSVRPRPLRSLRPVPRRRPPSTIPWWCAVIALAGLTASIVHGALARAAEAEARWQTTRTVVVATRPIALGEPIDGAVTVRRLPRAATPSGALTDVPKGRRAMAAIGRGEVVTDTRVTGSRAAGLAAVLPPGTRAVVIPLAVGGLPVEPGDHVDLLSSASVAEAGEIAHPIARAALVLEVSAKALVVAVGADNAVKVAIALGQGPLVPALVPPGG